MVKTEPGANKEDHDQLVEDIDNPEDNYGDDSHQGGDDTFGADDTYGAGGADDIGFEGDEGGAGPSEIGKAVLPWGNLKTPIDIDQSNMSPAELQAEIKRHIVKVGHAYQCSVCNKEFAGGNSAVRNNALRHVLIMHIDHNLVFICTRCASPHSSRNTFSRHLKEAHGVTCNIWHIGLHSTIKQRHTEFLPM